MSNLVTRQTLLQRACDPSNEDAWEEFVDFYQKFIIFFLLKMNIPRRDSEDITQQVLLRLWKNISKYDRERAKFRTWLVTIIRNTAYSHMTSQSKSNYLSLDSSEWVLLISDDKQKELEEHYEKEWRTHLTQVALDNISKNFRGQAIEVFKLSLEGKETDEVAAGLNIKPQSVRNLKNRVKLALIKEVERLRSELET
jgi:RNA polymerase sigma factor (sigma-70 family)